MLYCSCEGDLLILKRLSGNFRRGYTGLPINPGFRTISRISAHSIFVLPPPFICSDYLTYYGLQLTSQSCRCRTIKIKHVSPTTTPYCRGCLCSRLHFIMNWDELFVIRSTGNTHHLILPENCSFTSLPPDTSPFPGSCQQGRINIK